MAAVSEADLEFFRNAREELLFRVKSRDALLRAHFVVQVSVIAIGLGIPLGSAKEAGAQAWPLAASPLLALGVYFLYAVEDRLVGHLSNYIRASIPGSHWENSTDLAAYRRYTLWWRFCGTGL